MPGGTRLGLFGGTFDPVHRGHLEVAQAVRRALALERVLLVVANEPWQKVARGPVTPAEDRFAMVEVATAGWPGLVPCRREIDRGGPSYTVDTVEEVLAEEHGCEVTLVVGADVVPELSTWHDEPRLRELVTLAVVDRPGSPLAPAPSGWRAVVVPVAPPDVSSTEVRARLEAGEPVGDLVPEPVMRCIRARGLYATER
ncbi:MAG: nicotinate-nucleotide adenylyltransferase [Actinomycetota bacterium]|nr:nicotinate-nucleotide adenylyltransferase [Actinomycetota bacterium]